jgi:hypothetical protein
MSSFLDFRAFAGFFQNLLQILDDPVEVTPLLTDAVNHGPTVQEAVERDHTVGQTLESETAMKDSDERVSTMLTGAVERKPSVDESLEIVPTADVLVEPVSPTPTDPNQLTNEHFENVEVEDVAKYGTETIAVSEEDAEDPSTNLRRGARRRDPTDLYDSMHQRNIHLVDELIGQRVGAFVPAEHSMDTFDIYSGTVMEFLTLEGMYFIKFDDIDGEFFDENEVRSLVNTYNDMGLAESDEFCLDTEDDNL